MALVDPFFGLLFHRPADSLSMATDYMWTSEGLFQQDAPVAAIPDARKACEPALDLLENVFGTQFAILDAESNDWLHHPNDQPKPGSDALAELCRGIVDLGQPEIIAYEEPLCVLALPLGSPQGWVVALATFVVRREVSREEIAEAAQALGFAPERTAAWAVGQTPWPADSLLRTAGLVTDHLATLSRLDRMEEETRSLSANLASTYEEISLLYRLTQNLRLSESDAELGKVALEWMEEVIPAEGLAIQLLPTVGEEESLTHQGRTQSELISLGQCPVDNDGFVRLIDYLGLSGRSTAALQPVVVNRRRTSRDEWPFAEICQLIVVPLVEGDNLFGWLAAMNHAEGAEFGTVEASLLSSVGAILGIHSGNIELYRQQAELLAGVVRALTSAIDAKDPYTCGHSDRVARVAVRLAEEVGCDQDTLKTLYLSGLLHDIGKIGIDDNVLRKPGSLTDEEYEHIKTHVNIGQKILADLKKLDNVIPVVLHHHESWDGKGYPSRLPAEEIPLVARIVAVADAFDAMGSDRPYRNGMPDEKIDAIFRSGAGKQWDPAVVEAFFRCRAEIRQIMHEGRAVQPDSSEVALAADA